MNLSGKKILMVIAPTNFRDEELAEPKKIFEEAGAQVTIASKGVSEARGMFGATASVDKDISEVSVGDFDALVFVGGSGTSVYFEDEAALRLAREAAEQGKVVGAICIAPSILANAGVLSGKRATVFSSEAGNFQSKGAQYTSESVVQDGNIITGDGPQAARDFGKKVAEALCEQ